MRSALEQGARAGSISGAEVCESTARLVVDDLLGGRMSDGLILDCASVDGAMVATATVSFESWTPLTPDFELDLSASTVVEP